MSSFDIRRFVGDLKGAGVVISNESDLISRVSAAKDPERELSRHFTQGRTLHVSFAVDHNRSETGLIQVFKDNGLDDGWSYREFKQNAKQIGE